MQSAEVHDDNSIMSVLNDMLPCRNPRHQICPEIACLFREQDDG